MILLIKRNKQIGHRIRYGKYLVNFFQVALCPFYETYVVKKTHRKHRRL